MRPRLLFIFAVLSVSGVAAQTPQIPRPVPESLLDLPPYNSAGLVKAAMGRKSFYGSAAVAMEKQLVFGCAHVVYDNGRWAESFGFARGYHQGEDKKPVSSDFTYARGFRLLEGYAANRHDDYFDYDFAVAYSGTGGDFGPVLNLAENAYNSLTGGADKRILGYPAYYDWNFEPGGYYLHETGDFDDPFMEDEGFPPYYYGYGLPYLVIDGVSTGPGNSGGPVLVNNGSSWELAGILVSGSWTSVGVYSLGGEAKAAADDLLDNVVMADAYEQQTAYAKRVVLPDNSPRSKSIRFNLRPSARQTVRIALYMNLTTADGTEIDAADGEIEAELRSPSGRMYPVPVSCINQSGTVLDAYIHPETSESGRWTLFVRDKKPGAVSILWRAVLSMVSK